MFKNILSYLAISLALSLFASAAQAHFQMVYTPDLLRERGGLINVKLPFTHPADSGYVMTVEPPEQLYVLKKGKWPDRFSVPDASTWTSAENTGDAYEVDATLRGLGDHIFVMQMAPYFEASEDAYIQQIVKTIVNVGTLPSGWNEDLGLAAEIVPLTKPYGILAGGSFTGVVKSNGQPVPFAEIEVEYVNYNPDMKNNRFSATANVNLPSDLFITMTIYADANGTFTFGIPKAGQWGFAALGVGEKTEFKGKELSQDAVIWVQAHDFKAVK